MEPNCTIKRTAIRPGFDTVRKLFSEYGKIEQAKDRLRRPGNSVLPVLESLLTG